MEQWQWKPRWLVVGELLVWPLASLVWVGFARLDLWMVQQNLAGLVAQCAADVVEKGHVGSAYIVVVGPGIVASIVAVVGVGGY